MASTKQKIKQATSSMKLDALCKAIEKIPTTGRFHADEAFRAFIQHALVCMVEANKHQCEPLFLTDANFRKLGFKPVDRDAVMPGQAEIGAATTAYFEAVQASKPFTDLLTPVHAHFLATGHKGLGQYFTPWDLAKVASAIAGDHHKRNTRPQQLDLSDPCCGAGALLLACIQDDLWAHDNVSDFHAAAISIRVHANDLDPFCSAMTALQLVSNQVIHGIGLGEVVIEVGNTLTRNTERVLHTKARARLAGGIAAYGSSATFAELEILSHLNKLGEDTSAPAATARQTCNDAYDHMAAWDRTWNELRPRFETDKAA